MKGLSRTAILGILVATLGCSGSPSNPPAGLNGAGSTFVYPLMVQWGSEYEHKDGGCSVKYRGLGSGDGIKHLIKNDVDFACTDGPMTDEELAKARQAGGEVLHIPLALGAVVPVYNLEEVSEPLKFTGPVLADIYLGKIKKWNDEPLRELNKGVKLPNKEIRVVHRRDDSGTTYIWSDYLSKVSPEWAKQVGRGNDVKWPIGDAEMFNGGVAQYVKDKDGSLGYVELSYAYRKDLTIGRVQNREKEFVRVTLKSITTAANNVLTNIPDDLRYSLTDAPGKGSYPICGTTWAIVYVHQAAGKGQELVDFLKWAIDGGQESAEGQFYARLPQALVERAEHKIEQIQVGK